MPINTPEFTLIELDVVSGGGSGRGRTFAIPSASGSRRSDHPLQRSIQSVRQGVQLISQNVAFAQRGGDWYYILMMKLHFYV